MKKIKKPKTLTFKVEQELWDLMRFRKRTFNNSLSEYLSSLILADVEPKREEIEQAREQLIKRGKLKLSAKNNSQESF